MASKICMASKNWNSQILSLDSIIIESLMWTGWVGWAMFGRDENGEPYISLHPLTYLPFALSTFAMMLMELYGTVKKHCKTMIAALAFRFIRFMYFLIISTCLIFNLFNLNSILPSQASEMVFSYFGITLYIWDFCKILLDWFLIPPSKYNQYETLP